jgi:hypothetical protein
MHQQIYRSQIDQKPEQTENGLQKKGCLYLFLAPFVSSTLGLLLALFVFSSLFAAWKAIENPPERPSRILAIRGEKIWVEAPGGRIYYNASSGDCQQDCWEKVDRASVDIPLDPYISERTTETCGLLPLITTGIDQARECQRNKWEAFSSMYSIRPDGSILAWHYTYGGEYYIWDIFYAVAGAGALFLIALIYCLNIWTPKFEKL